MSRSTSIASRLLTLALVAGCSGSAQPVQRIVNVENEDARRELERLAAQAMPTDDGGASEPAHDHEHASDDPDAGGPAHDQLALTAEASLEYVVVWSWEGASWDEAQQAYVVTTPQGATVTLDALEISTSTFELVACEHDHDTDAGTSSVLAPALDVLRSLNPFAATRAHADHSYDMGPSYVSPSLADDAWRDEALAAGDATLDAGHYCELHQTMSALDLDEGEATTYASLRAHGHYAPHAGAPEQALDVTIALSMASLEPLHVEALDGAALVVEVERSAVRALAEVDLHLTGVDLAYDFLRALAQTSRVTVRDAAQP